MRGVVGLVAICSLGACELVTHTYEVRFVDASVDIAADGAITADSALDAIDVVADRHARDSAPEVEPPDHFDVLGDVATDSSDAPVCAAPLCDGGCVNFDQDPNNCARCGRVCPSGTNSNAGCLDGNCTLTCASGFGDCDGDPANGCESPLDQPTHCGDCMTVCAPVANATNDCTARRCAIHCTAGFANCDGIAVNGCETPLGTPAHCGSCAACPVPANAQPTCSNGACGFTCGAGFGDCDMNPATGCEARLNTATDCGSCGNACPNGVNCTTYGALTGCCSPLTTGNCGVTHCSSPEPACHQVGASTTCCVQ